MNDNALLWRPESGRDHVESLFVKLNVPDRREAFWVQFGARTLRAEAGESHGHVMAVRFSLDDPNGNAAVKERFARHDVVAADGRLDVSMGDCHLDGEGTRGRLFDGDGSGSGNATDIAWDLRFGPPRSSLRHLPWAFLYRAPLPRTKATSPALDMDIDGWFEVNGERTTVEHAPGMQGHNWGSEHAYRWAWCHSNCLSGERPGAENAVFEGLAAKLAIGPVKTPWISLLHLRYGNEVFTVDTIRWPMAVRSEVEGLRWTFSGTRGKTRLQGVAAAPAERFVGVNYLLPNGRKIPCLNATPGALELKLFRRERAAWQLADVLRTRDTAALELGGGDGHPGVRMLID